MPGLVISLITPGAPGLATQPYLLSFVDCDTPVTFGPTFDSGGRFLNSSASVFSSTSVTSPISTSLSTTFPSRICRKSCSSCPLADIWLRSFSGRRPEKLKQQMGSSGQLEQLYLQIRDGKVVDKLVEMGEVTEVDEKTLAEEFKNLPPLSNVGPNVTGVSQSAKEEKK